MVIIVQHCECAKWHWTVHLQWLKQSIFCYAYFSIIKKRSLKKEIVITTRVTSHLTFPSLSFPIGKVRRTTPTLEYCDNKALTWNCIQPHMWLILMLSPCSIPMMGGPVLKSPFTYTPRAQLEELVNAWAKWEVCCAI